MYNKNLKANNDLENTSTKLLLYLSWKKCLSYYLLGIQQNEWEHKTSSEERGLNMCLFSEVLTISFHPWHMSHQTNCYIKNKSLDVSILDDLRSRWLNKLNCWKLVKVLDEYSKNSSYMYQWYWFKNGEKKGGAA